MNKEVYFLLSDSQSNVFCKLYSHIVRPVISFGLVVRRIVELCEGLLVLVLVCVRVGG